MSEEFAFENANAMPAATWHRLNANGACIRVPAGIAAEPQIELRLPDGARGGADDFATALGNMQSAWEASHPAPTAEELAELAAFSAAEADATYGGTAQSAYQMAADALEESRSLAAAFESALGAEARSWMRSAAGESIVIHARPHEEVDASIAVSGTAGAASIAAVDIIAEEGSTISLSLACMPHRGQSPLEQGQPPVQHAGLVGTSVRVIAEADAHVEIARTQVVGDGFSDLDDSTLILGKRASANIRQTVLGAGEAFCGLCCDLRGDAARIRTDTRYLGAGVQKRDFNYIIRHHGQKSESTLDANGVLAGSSDKVLRGTIDLIRGAKGAAGQENETVLIVGEQARNRTVPVILCNEDDVAGNHGATIGHIRPEQMFYLASRGLSQEAAEQMFVNAVAEQALLAAPDETIREAVREWIGRTGQDIEEVA